MALKQSPGDIHPPRAEYDGALHLGPRRSARRSGLASVISAVFEFCDE